MSYNLRYWKIGLGIAAVLIIIAAVTSGVVFGAAPGKGSTKKMKAEIVGPGFPPNHPVENIGFLKGRFYYAALLPNTKNVVVVQVKFKTGTMKYEMEESISRILTNGDQRDRTTGAELEQLYQDASVATAKYYGDKYVLANIRTT